MTYYQNVELVATDDEKVCVATGPLGALGDFVWYDTNNNGRQDGGEPGVPDVEVRLLDCQGGSWFSTTTDADGKYLFYGLIAGDYQVQFLAARRADVAPPANFGTDDKDSDALASGLTACLTLGRANQLTVDAGLYEKPPCDLDFVQNGGLAGNHFGHPSVFTYTVNNISAFEVTDVVIVDDAGTPDYPGDSGGRDAAQSGGRGEAATFQHARRRWRCPVHDCRRTNMVIGTLKGPKESFPAAT